MKRILFLVLGVFVVILTQAQKVEKLWETEPVFNVPESVLFDDTVMYVSNVNGNPDEKNALGYISRMNSDGEVIELKWVTGLNAPKGMGVFNEKLYVTDIDRVAVIDRTKGEIIQFIPVADAKFLNDISISNAGLVAISDMNNQTIHFIEGLELKSEIKNSLFDHVNGLYWDGDVLLAGTNNIIYKVNVASMQIEAYITGTGGVDGLEKLDAERFIISDWQGKVQIVSVNNDPIELFNTTGKGYNAADIGCFPQNKIVLVPTFFGNTVAAYKIVE